MATTDGRRGAYQQYGNADADASVADALLSLDPVVIGDGAVGSAPLQTVIGSGTTVPAAATPATVVGDGNVLAAGCTDTVIVGTQTLNCTGPDNIVVDHRADLQTFDNCIVLGHACIATASDQLLIGSATHVITESNTASAGGVQAVPATVKSYLPIVLNGTDYKIPLFDP